MTSDSATRIAVAYISRTKGVRGYVKAQPLTEDLQRFGKLDQIVLQKEGQADRSLQLQQWNREGPSILFKFAGIETPEDAREILVKGYITVARDEVVDLPRDTYYIFELVGCRVEGEQGHLIGHIDEVLEMPSIDVYVVRGDAGEVLIPAVSDYIIDVSTAERRVRVRGIDALLGLACK